MAEAEDKLWERAGEIVSLHVARHHIVRAVIVSPLWLSRGAAAVVRAFEGEALDNAAKALIARFHAGAPPPNQQDFLDVIEDAWSKIR